MRYYLVMTAIALLTLSSICEARCFGGRRAARRGGCGGTSGQQMSSGCQYGCR